MQDFNDLPIIIELKFDSSHFIYTSSGSEDLHGHNYVLTYGLKCASSSFLNENLKKSLVSLSNQFNNKIIVATRCPLTEIICEGESIKIVLPGGAFYQFPVNNCFLLPDVNSTCECISKFVFDTTKEFLDHDWEKVSVAVAEIYRQKQAIYRVSKKQQL